MIAGLKVSLRGEMQLHDAKGHTVEVSDSFIQLGKEAVNSTLRGRDSLRKGISVSRFLQKDL